ncbi:hypothetical protein [Erwinia rhapontici]|uniref:hypothetical protein n=1 Tax=Erwinia rhapontici TaxID=55212 RepID=UPI0013314107|nr:hypothetical protein [Erwinia rhapontici]MBP2156689.1 hypothetical protein [Erwinia rhapontici]
MKVTLIVVAVMAVGGVVHAADVAQAEEAVSHAERGYSTAQGSYRNAALYSGSGVNGSHEESAMKQAATNRAQAYADLNAAKVQASRPAPTATPSVSPTATLQATPIIHAPQAVPQKTPSHSVPNKVAQLTPQIAPTKQLTPSYSVTPVKAQLTPQIAPSKKPQITGATYRSYVSQLQVATINVAASSLKPTTPVNVTVNGVTQTVAASILAPSTQVAVPHIPAFIHETTGNAHDQTSQRSGRNNDNRGNDNAHSHAFGGHGYGADNSRSEGFGGHSHFH